MLLLRMTSGYIYLVHTREFINSKEHIYKLGRCRCWKSRLSKYPKGSRLIMCMYVTDQVDSEKKLLSIFDSKYERQTNIGREYYKGCINDMCKVINEELCKVRDTSTIPEIDDADAIRKEIAREVEEQKKRMQEEKKKLCREKRDLHTVLGEFLTDNEHQYSTMKVNLQEFQEAFVMWLDQTKCRTQTSMKDIVHVLTKVYKVRTIREDGMTMIMFPQLGGTSTICPLTTEWLYSRFVKDEKGRVRTSIVYDKFVREIQDIHKKSFGGYMKDLGHPSKCSNSVRYYMGITERESA